MSISRVVPRWSMACPVPVQKTAGAWSTKAAAPRRFITLQMEMEIKMDGSIAMQVCVVCVECLFCVVAWCVCGFGWGGVCVNRFTTSYMYTRKNKREHSLHSSPPFVVKLLFALSISVSLWGGGGG